MIYAIKKNRVIGQHDVSPEEVKGVTLVSGAEDLAAMKISALVSIHNSCVAEDEQIKGFENVDQAVGITWAAIEKFSIPEKAAKPTKAPKEAKEPRVTDRSRIRDFLADKDAFKIDDIVELVGGTKSNASTTITLLVKPGKCGKEGPIPFAYDKTEKVYNRIDPADVAEEDAVEEDAVE